MMSGGNWFSGCVSEADIKTRWRDLCKQYHPDLGGCLESMQAINAAYEAALRLGYVAAGFDPGKAGNKVRVDSEVADWVQGIISSVPDYVTVSLVGHWVWFEGTRKEDTDFRAVLKDNGARWSGRHKCWYWRPEWMKWGRAGKKDLNGIKNTWGCQSVDGAGMGAGASSGGGCRRRSARDDEKTGAGSQMALAM